MTVSKLRIQFVTVIEWHLPFFFSFHYKRNPDGGFKKKKKTEIWWPLRIIYHFGD